MEAMLSALLNHIDNYAVRMGFGIFQNYLSNDEDDVLDLQRDGTCIYSTSKATSLGWQRHRTARKHEVAD